MTISLDRRVMAGAVVLAALAVGAAGLAMAWRRAAGPAPATAQQVAADFVRAYYTVDYRDQRAWLVRLQPFMTEAGFGQLENQLAPAIWKIVEPAQFTNTSDQVAASPAGLAAEGQGQFPAPHDWQIQRVRVYLKSGARWPGMGSDTARVNVLLERLQSDGLWRVVTTLSDDSVALFQVRGGGQ